VHLFLAGTQLHVAAKSDYQGILGVFSCRVKIMLALGKLPDTAPELLIFDRSQRDRTQLSNLESILYNHDGASSLLEACLTARQAH
jgi:hypothetical protein